MSSKKDLRFKKLVLVLATFTLVIAAIKEAFENVEDDKNPRTTAEVGEDGINLKVNLAPVSCIQYPICFSEKIYVNAF